MSDVNIKQCKNELKFLLNIYFKDFKSMSNREKKKIKEKFNR